MATNNVKDHMLAFFRNIRSLASNAINELRRLRRARPDEIEAFVTNLYSGILGRAPDPDGFSHHLNKLGSRPSFRDARDSLHAFVNSEEAKWKRGGESEAWCSAEPVVRDSVKAVISLGSHCLTSTMLKKFDLKKFSCPFDWIFSNAAMAAHCINDDFDIFLDRKYHQPVPIQKRMINNANYCDHTYYRDKFGIKTIFNHYDVTVQKYYDYYCRCVERFRETIRSDHRTLLVMITPDSMMKDEDFGTLCAAVRPFSNAELLVVRTANRQGRFGGEIVASQERHMMYDLNLIGRLGTISFTERGDEAMFRYILDQYKFDLRHIPAA